MPFGLQTFDSNGVLMLDATHRIGRIVTSFESGATNSSRTVPELQDAGTPFFQITTNADYFAEYFAYPDVTITDTTVSWAFLDYQIPISPFGPAPRRSVVINVGVY
ncbi:hypothetical protein KSS94_18715 [Pseudomonas fakonensis]|uniref:Uncharacterized protein n=1 Tax=Pseudomonas fakonensis TaxID=2842355 RepID=A0ABX8N3T4_9PSED|nr:hypothetical protein [Pseudomonas fakonensis]QXH49968.1 hypothetical protein KSS94_18715 [Pseudomonas fakonensis]